MLCNKKQTVIIVVLKEMCRFLCDSRLHCYLHYSPNSMSELKLKEDGTFEFLRGVVDWVFSGNYTVENNNLSKTIII